MHLFTYTRSLLDNASQVSTLLGALSARSIVSDDDAHHMVSLCVSASVEVGCLSDEDWQHATEALQECAEQHREAMRQADAQAQQAEQERLRQLEKLRQLEVCFHCC